MKLLKELLETFSMQQYNSFKYRFGRADFKGEDFFVNIGETDIQEVGDYHYDQQTFDSPEDGDVYNVREFTGKNIRERLTYET